MASKKRTTSGRRGTPAKAKARRGNRTEPGRYKGLYIRVTREASTKARKPLDEGKILLAIGDADDNGWVPIIFRGKVDFVHNTNVSRIRMN